MKQNPITPLAHRVVVRPLNPDYLRNTIIEIPESYAQKHRDSATMGVIQSIGPSAWPEIEENKRIQVGDLVAYRKFSGVNIKCGESRNKDDFVIMNDEDILGRIEDPKLFGFDEEDKESWF